MVLISDILATNNLKVLSLLFFNLGEEKNDCFLVKISYKKSKFAEIDLNDQVARENNNLFMNYFNLPFKLTGKSTHVLTIKNDLNISRSDLLAKINSKIQVLRFSYSSSDFGKTIISSFFIPRGSADINRTYYAVDILRHNITESYIDNLLSILMSLEDITQFNINFRELQPEFVEGENRRNTQLRINLKWFYTRYYSEVENLNVYKANILKSQASHILISSYNNSLSSGFIERALFYKEKILGNSTSFEKLSQRALKQKVKTLRDKLDFKIHSEESNDVSRNRSIVNLAIISQPDICFSCKDQYDLMDRTFLLKNEDRPYLELHHVISFGADKSGDVLENLVKLCPACHRALTPNRAEKDYQKNIISNILENSESAYEYVSNFVEDTSSKNDMIEFVFSNLK